MLKERTLSTRQQHTDSRTGYYVERENALNETMIHRLKDRLLC